MKTQGLGGLGNTLKKGSPHTPLLEPAFDFVNNIEEVGQEVDPN